MIVTKFILPFTYLAVTICMQFYGHAFYSIFLQIGQQTRVQTGNTLMHFISPILMSGAVILYL